MVQLRRLVRSLAGMPRPVVLLGDLNLPGATAALASRMRRLAAAPSYPVPSPRVQLDQHPGHRCTSGPGPRILAYGALPDVVASGTRHTAVSDHLAVFVDLADRPPSHSPEAGSR